jgi:sodium-dependent dicarboxylate transporter 2/3/5
MSLAKTEKTKPGRWIAIGIVVILMILSRVLPTSEAMTREGLAAMMLFLSAIVLWVGGSWPFWISGCLILFIMPLFNVMTMNDAYNAFGGSSFSFLLAAYAITAALTETTWADRIAGFIVSKFGSNSKRLVYVLMFVCAFMSSFMANLATTAMFIALIRPIMAKQCPEGETSNLAKCMYIGIPVAVNIGGTMMICGTPSNLIILSFLEGFTGLSVSFLSWMLVGIPNGIICVFICAFVLTHVFKPEPLKEELVEEQKVALKEMPPVTKKEKITVVIIVATIIAWILSTWVKALNTTLTAFICMGLLMFPGIDIIGMKKLHNTINWNSVLLCGAVNALVKGISMHAVPDWVVNNVFAGLNGASAILLLLAASLFFAAFRNFMPGSTSFVTFMALPMFGIAQAAGLSIVAVSFMITFWSCCSLILPFDPIYLVGMPDGYYTPNDTMRWGLLGTAVLVPIVPFLLLAVTSFIK